MNSTVHTLQALLSDPRRARVARRGSGVLAMALLAALPGWRWLRAAPASITPMGQALAGSAVAALATALGALPALFVRRISSRWEDIMLGFGAGVMMAASCFSLILPGVAAGSDILGSRPAGAALVATGLMLGALFLLLADKSIPHEHVQSGRHGPDWMQLRRVWLMVFAIALHNFPEGMARVPL